MGLTDIPVARPDTPAQSSPGFTTVLRLHRLSFPLNVSGTKSRSEPDLGPQRLIPCAPRTKRTTGDVALRPESENSEHIRRSGPIRSFREPLATDPRGPYPSGVAPQPAICPSLPVLFRAAGG